MTPAQRQAIVDAVVFCRDTAMTIGFARGVDERNAAREADRAAFQRVLDLLHDEVDG